MSETKSRPLLECSGLRVSYGPIVALEGLDLELGGGAVGLLGPNGAGKSTLLKTMLGFIRPERGSLRLLGRDVLSDPRGGRESIGYMPEQTSYVPELKTWAAVAYAAELAGLPRRVAVQRAHEVLSFVGVGEERYRTTESLSPGKQQRVKLAQALVHGPRLLLLDEPTNGLDPRGRRELLGLIRDVVHRMGLHVMLSSHLLPDVESVCSSVVVLERGRLVMAGRMDELRGRDLARYALWARGPEQQLKQALSARGVELVSRSGEELILQLPADTGTAPILEACVEARVELRHLKPVERSLEQAFLEAIGH